MQETDKAWKQHNERKRGHYEISTLFNNGDDYYFGEEKSGKIQRNSSMLFKIAEGSEFQRYCEDAKAKAEFPALMDGGAEASVTNNEDLLLTNLIDSAASLEGFNGAAAKAQGQGDLIFSTSCYTTEWFSREFGRIVPK